MRRHQINEPTTKPPGIRLTSFTDQGIASSARIHVHARRRRTRNDGATSIPLRIVDPMGDQAPLRMGSTCFVEEPLEATPLRQPFALPIEPETQLITSLIEPVVLEPHCPREPQVQMIVDGTGRLHLWCNQANQEIRSGILSLINARFWARENIRLIALTRPECRFDLGAEPMLHLFTDNVVTAMKLRGTLGPFFKLHILPCSPHRPGDENFDRDNLTAGSDSPTIENRALERTPGPGG